MDNQLMQAGASAPVPLQPRGLNKFFRLLWKQRALVLMSVPFVLWLFLFRYVPIWGWTIAFQNFKPGKPFSEQQWAGIKHFTYMFNDERFWLVLRNTFVMSAINLVLGFLTAITLALMLNEVRRIVFKRFVQTVSYLPHFLSWVVAAGIVRAILDPDGVINEILLRLGLTDEKLLFLGVGEWFWGIYGAVIVWKEVGWNTIIYLAAMTMIDPSLYEAAEMDGAGRFRKIWHITLPGIRPVITVLLIMNIGYLIESGFEPQYLLGNGLNMRYSENLDIYVLKYGIEQFNYPLSVAASVFKTVVSFALLFTANNIAKRLGETRLY
jgi:ABC-type polysaccharide transport system, permease component